MSWLTGIKKFLGFDGVSESLTKIVDKVAGTDWTPSEKSKFILDYCNATKHQSPTRRLIATLVVLGIILFTGAYAVVGAFEYFYVFFSIDTSSLSAAAQSENLAKIKTAPLTLYRNDLLLIIKELKEPFMIVLGFYFLMHVIKK